MSGKFVLLEVASVLAIIGSVAAIAVPKVSEARRRRSATTVSADVETVRAAVYAFYSDSAYFPPEGVQGDIPLSLEPYLPSRFSFRRAYGTLEYRYWPRRAALASAVAAPADSAGASVATDSVPMDPGRSAVVDSALARARRGARRGPAMSPRGASPSPAVAPPPAGAARALPDNAVLGRIVGISVTTRDPRIGLIAAHRARGMARFIVGEKVTFVIFGG
jgi:type II secretory pathway pseudopilin PulG